MKPWDIKPKLDHLSGVLREQMEERRRHRQVRYLLFALQTAKEAGRPLESVPDLPPGFIEFWLHEKPSYQLDHNKARHPIAPDRCVYVHQLGGYSEFAKRWDVDADLLVYLRHSSVWQEWNTTLARVVPILGE